VTRRCLAVALLVVASAVCTTATATVWAPDLAAAQTSPAPAPPGAAEGHVEQAAEPVRGQYNVLLRDTADATVEAQRLAVRYSGRVLRVFDTLHGFLAQLTGDEALAMSTDPAVALVEEDGVVRAEAVQDPAPNWGLDRVDQSGFPLDGAYSYDSDGAGVTVYVLDSGIDPGQPDFAGRATIGADFVGDGQNGVDCYGHGTHVAGTVGGTVYGVAKAVSLVAVRVLDCTGSGTFSGVIDAVDWVTANHAPGVPAVVNMSFGGARSQALNDAVEQSIASGITYVTAAGNGTNNDGVPVDARQVSPASAPDAVTVGATGDFQLVRPSDTRASFSNYGSCVDLYAPGVGIVSDWLGSSTRSLSGTSMAAPFVTGVAARFLQGDPGASPDEVVAALVAAAGPAVTGGPEPGRVVSANFVPGAPSIVSGSCGSEFTPVPPTRILDTRGDASVTCNRMGTLAGGTSFAVQVTGCAGIPAGGVSAVVANVTVDAPSAPSFLTLWPAGTPRPVASNLNFVAGQTVPNLVTVEVGAGGQVSVFLQAGASDVVIDVVGWYSEPDGFAGSRLHPLTPARLLDTRATGPIGAGGTLTLPVAGVGGVPAAPSAVVLNVTVTGPTQPGFVTVFPGDLAAPPNASSLNFVAGSTVPNLVIVGVPANGAIRIYNHAGSAHVVVDVLGWYGGDRADGEGLFVALPPSRILDTRVTGVAGPNTSTVVPVAGLGGVPASGAGAVVLNATVTEPTDSGFLTVYPADATLPPTSNLNFVAGQTVPNLVVSRLSDAGALRAYNSNGFTHVIFDVFGYFTSS
jgi:subtilisin family serine protease